MRKRITSLLLTIFLAASLFSIPAKADTVSASVTLAGQALSVNGYDTPAYFANTHTESDTDSTAPNSQKWNAKLIWHSGDALPSLYLKGFAVDAPGQAAITVPAGQPMRIIISEDSRIKAQFGILYQSDLEILSEGEAGLAIEALSGAITSGTATGCKLTIDASLDLFVKSYYDATSHILQTNQADLTINGGNIKIRTDDEKSLFGIVTRNSGNIIINDGNLDVTSSIGAAPANGSIHASGKLIINGGTVKATAKTSTPLYAKNGIEVTGGFVDISSPYYGISAGTPDEPAAIAIKGGTVRISAKRAFFTYPLLDEGVFAYAGADEASAKVYDGTRTPLAKEPWMLISNDPSLRREPEPTQATATTPTALTTTAPSIAPTTPTAAPTGMHTAVSTAAPTEPTQAFADALSDSQPLLWLAATGTVGLLGIVITLLAFRRKP